MDTYIERERHLQRNFTCKIKYLPILRDAAFMEKQPDERLEFPEFQTW